MTCKIKCCFTDTWFHKKNDDSSLFIQKNSTNKLIVLVYVDDLIIDTIKRLMSYPKCRLVEVINNPARPGSNHKEVNYIKL